MPTDPNALTAVIALVIGALGAPAVLKLIELWGARGRVAVEADLTLAGGWRDLADKLSARVAILEAAIDRLRTENAELHAENQTLHAEIARLTARVSGLERELEGHATS